MTCSCNFPFHFVHDRFFLFFLVVSFSTTGKVTRFGEEPVSTALIEAVACDSWNVANELVFNLLTEKGVEDLELDLRDAGRSLVELLSSRYTDLMARKFKRVIANAVALADDLDVVTTQPRQATPRPHAQASDVRVGYRPASKYHTGLCDLSLNCCCAPCCYYCNLAEVFGDLSGMGATVACCILCGATCFVSGVLSLMFGPTILAMGQVGQTCADFGLSYFCTHNELLAAQIAQGFSIHYMGNPASCLVHTYVRNKFNTEYNIKEDLITTGAVTICCASWSALQMANEMEWRRTKAR